jgi:asparagine synthase (glutamine-hydrolysing)
MAMRRLSIIDLNHGWQPHKNEDETIVSMVNGENYNYIELTQELKSKGHRFRTESDCEVLVHLYEEFGIQFVHKLRGMFAFALWDKRQNKLILGRDRMGEKPLYLHQTKDGIWFASELKILLATGQVPFEVSPDSILSYFYYGWIPEPESAVTGITKLPAGHVMVINTLPWSYKIEKYWCIEDAPTIKTDPKEAIRAELETIGKMIFRSDVPIGISLSGGIDSSLIAALAKKHSGKEVKAFTIGYEGRPAQDERGLAQQFSQDINLDFHSIEMSTGDLLSIFPKMTFDRDDPIADLSGCGYTLVSQCAKESGCPVLFQGQGIDELLWGYPWAKQSVFYSLRKFGGANIGLYDLLMDNAPKKLSRPQLVRFTYFIAGLLQGWRNTSPGTSTNKDSLVLYDTTDGFQISDKYVTHTFTNQFKSKLINGKSKALDFIKFKGDGARIDIQILTLLCNGYLLENGLSQGDRLSMANSVELRLPFVDYKFAECLTGIQKHTPVYFEDSKKILHQAAHDYLPDYIFNRPKRGFNPPVAAWVKALRDKYSDELKNGSLVNSNILDPKAAKNLVSNTSRFSKNYYLFQMYLALEFWHRSMASHTLNARKKLQ